jgi:hypothetical protein
MPRYLFAIILAVVAAPIVGAASGTDPRLLTVKKAFVVPVDDLGEDKPIAVCLAKNLADQTPLTIVEKKEDADVILKVSGHLPSATTRVMMGAMGGTPSAHLFIELPGGQKLWDDGAKLRRALGKTGKLDSADGANTVYCGLADELLDTLRTAMRNARDKAK